jgi:hypothetical protein
VREKSLAVMTAEPWPWQPYDKYQNPFAEAAKEQLKDQSRTVSIAKTLPVARPYVNMRVRRSSDPSLLCVLGPVEPECPGDLVRVHAESCGLRSAGAKASEDDGRRRRCRGTIAEGVLALKLVR